MLKLSLILKIVILLSISISAQATDYIVTDQLSCESLPVQASWDSRSHLRECKLEDNFVIKSGDLLRIFNSINLIVPPNITLTNDGGTIQIILGSLKQKGGTVINFGHIDNQYAWIVSNDASMINCGTFIINDLHSDAQLHISSYATFSNLCGTVENYGSISVDQDSNFLNVATVVNNDHISVAGYFENNFIVNNENGTIEVECTGDFTDKSTLIGNTVEGPPYCISGGLWSIPGSWNKGSVPPNDANIIVNPGEIFENATTYMDTNFTLSSPGTLTVNANFVINLDIHFTNHSDVAVSDMAAVRLPSGDFVLKKFTNFGSISNFGDIIIGSYIEFLNFGEFDNYDYFYQDYYSKFVNGGVFTNYFNGYVISPIRNGTRATIINNGGWDVRGRINFGQNNDKTNFGTVHNLFSGEFRIKETLYNKGVIHNDGLFYVANNYPNPAENPSRLVNDTGLITNSETGVLELTTAESTIDNTSASEIRNYGIVPNSGTINNDGRFCNEGEVTGNPVTGNALEPVCNRPPIARVRVQSGLLECTAPTTSVYLFGSSSRDPDIGDILSYSWTPTTGLASPLSRETTGEFALGNQSIMLTVTDSVGETDSATVSFNVLDTTSPELTCPENISLVANEFCIGTAMPSSASASDICDVNPQVTLSPVGTAWPLDQSTVTHTATDSSGNSATCTSIVEVIDDTPPTVQCNTENAEVLPGVPVSFQATANDNCSVTSVSVTSYDCWTINRAGKRVDKTDKCVVSISGSEINVIEPSGPGTNIGWMVEGKDGSGNVKTISCQVVSTRPTRKR